MSLPIRVACAVVMVVAVAACLGRRAVPGPNPALAEPPPTRPEPDRAGPRGLRATFETLPQGSEATLRLLTANHDAWVERWRLVADARRTLDVNYFILHEDVFGVAFLGHLLEKAREGVRVRVVLDGLGTKLSRSLRGEDYLDELAEAGVAVKTYRPLWTRWLQALVTFTPTAAVASNHDKIVVVDGRHSLIGGRNIGFEYFASPRADERVFHDVDVRLDSASLGAALTRIFESQYESDAAWKSGGELLNLRPRARELRAAYLAMDRWLRGIPPDAEEGGIDWQAELEKVPRLRGALTRYAPRSFTGETRVIDSPTRPGPEPDAITDAIARFVGSARRSILVQSPYLVLSEEGVALLAEAGRRGVAITVLTNSPVSSDNALSQAFFLEQWPDVLARVPRMRLFVGGSRHTLHGKSAVFDEQVALVGTYNLDPTSMALNSEVVAATWSAPFAREVAAGPRGRIARGAPDVYEYTIERQADGTPRRDADGKPIVAFGPRDHCTPEEWTALAAYWTALRAASNVGFSPIL